MWEIGRHGNRALVLDPEEAKQAHPVPLGSSADTYVPPNDIVARILPFSDDEVRLLPKISGVCKTAYPRPS